MSEQAGLPAETVETNRRIARFGPLISAIAVVVLAVALGAVIVWRENGLPFDVDTEWMDEIIEHRSRLWEVPALLMDFVGGGIVGAVVVPIVTIVGLLLWRRRWAALFYGVATAVSAIVVQVLKNVVGRPRPADILVTADFGSFPSGHSANAATLAVTLGIVFARTWVWFWGVVYTLLMMLSRTYLGAHWVSDTIGGLLVGVGVAIIVWAPLAYKLYLENQRDHLPVWKRIQPPAAVR